MRTIPSARDVSPAEGLAEVEIFATHEFFRSWMRTQTISASGQFQTSYNSISLKADWPAREYVSYKELKDATRRKRCTLPSTSVSRTTPVPLLARGDRGFDLCSQKLKPGPDCPDVFWLQGRLWFNSLPFQGRLFILPLNLGRACAKKLRMFAGLMPQQRR